jgi:glycine hydroxymethyltransferase
MLEAVDPDVAGLIAAEERRQANSLTLIPSENHVSPAVLEATASVFTNKYSEGYPGRRYYEGQACVDPLEALARERACAVFGAEHANVQPYSGSPANLAVYAAFLQPGDAVLGMALDAGGHLTHGHGVSVTGKWFRAVRYGVRADTGRIDLDEVRELALRERPSLIWCGGTALPRIVDFAGFAAIAREADTVLAADIAHVAGLVAGGVHPSPLPRAGVVTTTTHKTLRGPRAAMILCASRHAERIDRAVFPGLQGGPHDHTTAALAVALQEAAQLEFCEYAERVVDNAAALADALLERGFDLVSGGTDTHLLLVDLRSKGVTGGTAAVALDRAGLVCNRNTIPRDPRKPLDPSGIRLGTPAITTRGLRREHMALIADWIDRGVTACRDRRGDVLARIRDEIAELAQSFPPPFHGVAHGDHTPR